MTIRYQCDDCGSVLKIKDQLAGTEGKCPKCKKKFIVPDAGESHAEESGEFESPSEDTVVSPIPKEAVKAHTKGEKARQAAADQRPSEKTAAEPASDPAIATTTVEKPKKAEKPARQAAADDEFDAAAFLMEGNDGPNKPSAGLTSEPAEPKKGPAWARGGRRPIAPPAAPAEDAKDLSPAASAANSQLSASANARDLLSKSMEEGRVRAASMPAEKERRPLIDFSGAKAELRRGLMYAVPVVVGAVLIYLAMSHMLASNVWMPELGRVRGRVTVDGKPFPNVRVDLTPVNPKVDLGNGKSETVRTASGVTDQDGDFEIKYMEGVRGAPIGKVRITIEPVVATPDIIKKIPAKYIPGHPTPDKRDVKRTGNDGEFDFDLKSGER